MPGCGQRLLQEPELGRAIRSDHYPQSGTHPLDDNDEGTEGLRPGGEGPVSSGASWSAPLPPGPLTLTVYRCHQAIDTNIRTAPKK